MALALSQNEKVSAHGAQSTGHGSIVNGEPRKNYRKAKCKFVIVRQFSSCLELNLAHNSPQKLDNYVIEL